jgi:hypothetical protein
MISMKRIALGSLFFAPLALAQNTNTYRIAMNNRCQDFSTCTILGLVGSRLAHFVVPSGIGTQFHEQGGTIDLCSGAAKLSQSLDEESGYTKFTMECSGLDTHGLPFKMVATIWAEQKNLPCSGEAPFAWDGRPATNCTYTEWFVLEAPSRVEITRYPR